MSEDTKRIAAVITEKSDGEFSAIASTASEDRHGEIVDQSGWDLKNFKNDPVILWAHDHTEPAIGKATRVWIDKTGTKPMLKFKAMISDATVRSREIKQLIQEGIIKTFSVGFRPLEMDGNTYLKQELLEISAVNVPANADAQMLAYKTLKNSGFKDDEIKQIGINPNVIDKLVSMDKAISDLQSAMKAQSIVNSPDKVLRKRQSLAKIIIRATDMMLGDDRHQKMTNDQKKRLVKVIKGAGEKLSTSQREQING